ncbi:co-chaperone YbbN [Photobacterium kishitanii]|uniref:Co-chaperone YbbN n=1 Tax=Photobacterium kishitanii TaxID=318456 RepID=A0A0B7JAQ1_9GAMM|nr:co-chaperone YbbN [Photobacterium kishitanii]PSU87873.1 co-chaperone YbbN [Photobacterium kishitanii]PSU88860.1 co-chaperone YbbN [Photobacterium kishitanii]PSU91571.1 co-chaperone YbbN [Photobacterium kishitanii]PSV19615.1 co-chaperone YbbN [Photobacterium kishitanii]CEO38398.1 putative thioredoxin domain-containing protein [Photobacterium kishitanii]
MYQNVALELNEQNLQQIIDQSMQAPVAISFWAPSMPETLEVNATLEKIAREYQGQFTLATVNCETQQMVASQFGVRGLPTVALFKDGQPVDGSAGPQTEQSLREMLARHLPTPEELQLQHALALVESQDYNQALALLRQLAHKFPKNSLIELSIAECLVAAGLFDEAELILATIPMQDQDAKYKGLIAKLELHKQAGNSPEIQQLEQKLAAEPNDSNVAFELAVQYSQVNRNEEALALLLNILRGDLNFADGNAKKTMMDILAALGQGNPIAATYRRQLYSLLY